MSETTTATKNEPATTNPAPAGAFRIIEPLYRNPISGQYAVLAELPDGRRLLRQQAPGQYGKPVHMFWQLDTDPAVNPTPLNNYYDELSEPHGLLEQAQWNMRAKLWRIETSPLEAEIQRFAQQFPLMAEHYGWTRAKPKRAFEIGVCWRQCEYDAAKAGDIDFEHYRDRHASGDDFGVHGKLGDIPPLDEAAVWTLDLQPVPVKNAHAVRTGLGVVRSEYPVEGRKGVAVTAITAMLAGSGRNFTVIRVATPAN